MNSTALLFFNDDELNYVNEQAAKSGCDWLFIVPRGAAIHPCAKEMMVGHAQRRPDINVVYADEILNGNSVLKPDINPELLFATNYIGFPLLVTRVAFLQSGGFRPEYGPAADHDLLLRLWAKGFQFSRLPQILLRSTRRKPQGAAVLKVVSNFCLEERPEWEVRPGRVPGTVRLGRRFDTYPRVTVIIPPCQSSLSADESDLKGKSHTHQLLATIARSTWPMDKLVVMTLGDNLSGGTHSPEGWPFCLTRFTPQASNKRADFTQELNRAWKSADTEVIIFVNDSIRVVSPDWVEALLTFALDPTIGGVGCRQLSPEDTIQHVGVVGGIFGCAARAWFGLPAEKPTYESWAEVHRNWSMVTGAVFATRKSILEEVGGFDEQLGPEYSDLDLCLRIGLMGYRVVYTPFAEMINYEKDEKANYGNLTGATSEMFRFKRRWRELLNDDPAYNAGLSRNSFVVSPKACIAPNLPFEYLQSDHREAPAR